MSQTAPHLRISASTVDRVIASDGLFELRLSDQEELCATLCAEALEHHLGHCASYRHFFERESARFNSRPEHPASYPPIPTSAFKRLAPLSVPERSVDKWCVSSGTKGVLSRVPRTRTCIERLLGSVRTGLDLVWDLHEDELDVFHLGPPHEVAGDIWFPFVMSLAELLYPATSFATDDGINHAAALDALAQTRREGRQAAVIGAPFAVLEFAHHALGTGTAKGWGEGIRIITGGGWKRWSGGVIEPAALRNVLARTFGTPLTQVRDAFNQVELNTAFFECNAHRKHVPPWVWPVARDPATLLAVTDGEVGLLSFVDASADAYPGFIVSDDVGVVHRGDCPCGREAVTVEFLRRVEGGGQRGCALAIEAIVGAST